MPTLPLAAIGRFLVVADPLEPADAILPLAGGLERVVYAAARLYRDQQYAPQLLLTDMASRSGAETNYAEQAREQALYKDVPDEAIFIIPGRASTTFEEAANACAFVQAQNWTSLIVVTSPHHTRRSRIIFRDACRGTGVSISVQPVPSEWYAADYWWQNEPWWQSPQGRREIGLEYLKLLAHFIGVR